MKPLIREGAWSDWAVAADDVPKHSRGFSSIAINILAPRKE